MLVVLVLLLFLLFRWHFYINCCINAFRRFVTSYVNACSHLDTIVDTMVPLRYYGAIDITCFAMSSDFTEQCGIFI